jgi:ribosomal protein L1
LKRKEELCEKTVNELYRSVDSLKSEELMNLVIYLAKLKNKRFITVIEVIMNRLDDLDYK